MVNGTVFTDYLDAVFHKELYQDMVTRATTKARWIMQESPFEAIAFTGVSGSAIGFILGHALNIPLICIRKTSEDSHYKSWCCEDARSFEGYTKANKYLIVDDFIASGRTVERIMEVIINNCGNCRCAAMLMFRQPEREKIFHPQDAALSHLHKDGIIAYSCAYNSWSEGGCGV